MKKLSLLFTGCFSLLSFIALATETEPNNTSSQANTFTVNSTNSGKIGTAGDVDWWKVTTTTDGQLSITLTPATAKTTWLYLYDSNHTTILASGNAAAALTLVRSDLRPGTFYLKVQCVSSSDTVSYSIKNVFTAPSQAKDVEPNNSITQATTFATNHSGTGHIGYYYNNRRDTSDWYKITTKSDSKLLLKLAPTSGKSISMSLYAGNGTSLIGSSSGSTAFSLSTNGLEDDIYYVKINAKTSSDYAPYTFTDSVLSKTTDTIILPQNYRIKDALKPANDVDWFKVTTKADGQLKLTLNPQDHPFTWIYLYDHNKTTLLNSAYSNNTFSVITDGLAAGTYYVKISCYYPTDTTAFTLADTLKTITQANDEEPNDNKTQAFAFPLNSSETGHVGYLYNQKRDTADWYKITTNADGRLDVNINPVNGSFLYGYLYDNDGTTLLASAYSSSPYVLSRHGLANGTYYLKLSCYYASQFTPYTISNALVKPAAAKDTATNGTKAQALTLKLNDDTTGHIGYYYKLQRDTTDWYKVTTNAEGKLDLTLTPETATFVYVYLYDNDGTTLLNSAYSNAGFTLTQDGLAAGTYYVKVNAYYASDFTAYTLANKLTKPSVANDAEPNNSRTDALTLAQNSTTTGHVGYYYNLKRDTADWFKITTNKNGMLRLKLTPATSIPLYVYLYDNNGTTLLNSSYSSSAYSLNTDGLAPGTYYVKVNCYYANNFTPYTITDSLITYSYANDAEPNQFAKQGTTVSANSTVTGNVNFYYKLAKDTHDWWKLNYTGSGNLSFTFNLEANKSTASIPPTWFYVYKDTLAAPVYSNYFSGASTLINLTGLSKTTYYIKVITYYTSNFVTYSFKNTFTAPGGLMNDGIANADNLPLQGLAPYKVDVYPNPVSGILHLQCSGAGPQLTTYSLRDVYGRELVKQGSLPKTVAGQLLNIDVRKYPAGTYNIQLTDIQGNKTSKEFIIIK